MTSIETRVGAGTFHTALGMAVFQGASFLAGILLAHKLGPAGLGRFQLVSSISIFSAMLIKLGMDESLVYRYPHTHETVGTNGLSLIAYAVLVPTLLGGVLGGMAWVGADYLGRWAFKTEAFSADLKMLPWVLPSTVMLLMLLGGLRALGRTMERAVVYYYLVSVIFLLGLLLPYPGGLSVSLALWIRVVSFVVGIAVAWILVLQSVSWQGWKLSAVDLAAFHRLSGLLVFVGLFQYLVEQPLMDLILVGRFASAKEMGIYAVAARLGSLVGIVSNAFSISLAPEFARRAAGDGREFRLHYEAASLWMARLGIYLSLAMVIGAHFALSIFGRDYQAGRLLLIIFAVAQGLVCILGPNSPVLLSMGRGGVEFFLTGSASILMVAGGLLLGSRFGVTGVAASTALAVVVLSWGRWLAVARHLPGRTMAQVLYLLGKGLIAALCAWCLARLTSPEGWRDWISLALFTTFYWVWEIHSCPTRGRRAYQGSVSQ